jgi:phage terminase small subunit
MLLVAGSGRGSHSGSQPPSMGPTARSPRAVRLGVLCSLWGLHLGSLNTGVLEHGGALRARFWSSEKIQAASPNTGPVGANEIMARERLTRKQEAFVYAYLETGSATESYRRAYDASGMTSGAIEVEGKRLLKHPLITLRVSAARQRAAARAEVTVAKILAELREAWELARDKGQPAAMVSASMGRAKVAGLIADKKEIEQPGDFLKDMSDEELAEFIRTEAAEVLPTLDERKAPPRKMRH